MQGKSVVYEEYFWNILRNLEKLKVPDPLESFLTQVECSQQQFMEVASFLKKIGLEVKMKEQQSKLIICPFGPQEKISFELSMSEWLSLQAHYPKMNECAHEFFHQAWQEKAQDLVEQYPIADLRRALKEELDQFDALGQLRFKHKDYIFLIEESLKNQNLLQVKLEDGKAFDLFTHKLVYLDGALSLVGEDCNDRCLVYFNIHEIQSLKPSGKAEYRANFSPVEVNDFIFAIRAVSGNEERLVLKIVNQAGINLNPPYHFLGNPYITSNMNGDMIWAASVEVSDGLFEWLYQIKDHIEILDPAEVKSQFYQYLQDSQKRKLAA
jgi:hypothetical protein